MAKPDLADKIRSFWRRAQRSIIDDCPPELYACEVCGKEACDTQEWLSCETRLAAAEYMKARAAGLKPESDCLYVNEVDKTSAPASPPQPRSK